jgi:hypothetical protein
MIFLKKHYEVYDGSKDSTKDLTFLFRSPGSGTQRLIGIAKEYRVEYLINGDQKLKNVLRERSYHDYRADASTNSSSTCCSERVSTIAKD